MEVLCSAWDDNIKFLKCENDCVEAFLVAWIEIASYPFGSG
jgi:hypothetical protein